MRAFVFTDATLARHAGRFVWLELDGEKPRNAAASGKLKIPAYPTLYVVDPATEKVALRWVGSATVPQLHKLLDEGHAAVLGKSQGVDALLARADALYGAGDDSAAVKAYEEVLARSPAGWPRYGRAVESLLFALQQTESYERCVALSSEALPRLAGTPSAANAAASGLGCALSLPEDHPRRAERIAFFEPRVLEMARDRSLVLETDDRSGMYGVLADAREAAGDSAGRRGILEEWAKLLEDAATAAKTPDQRTVFDSHRLGVYLELGQPERAVPMLERSERDFPDDYNPPARLAIAYQAMRRNDQALAASARALARAYGPRKLRLWQTRADILVARGDTLEARRALAAAIREGEGLPEAQRPRNFLAGLRRRLDAMGGAVTP